MPARGCLHERGVAIVVLVLHICPRIQQYLHHVLVATATGVGQGSVPNTAGRKGGEEGGREANG